MTIVPQTRVVTKPTLSGTHPDIAAQWAHDLNTRPLDTITYGSMYKAHWRCSLNHCWQARVDSRATGNGCPVCSNQKVLAGYNDLASRYPHLMPEWDYDNNPPPDSILPNTHKKFKWICSADKTHLWSAPAYTRIKGHGCPKCVGQLAHTGVNDLATTHPTLAREWSPGNDKRPTEVMGASHYMAKWLCLVDEDHHPYLLRVDTRSIKKQGCPSCTVISAVEVDLRQAISNLPGHTELASLRIPIPFRSKPAMWVDYAGYLPDGRTLVVEYDGAYWHRDKVTVDTEKTVSLLDSGYIVVRVREQSRSYVLDPLPLTHPNFYQVFHTFKGNMGHQNIQPILDFVSSLSTT